MILISKLNLRALHVLTQSRITRTKGELEAMDFFNERVDPAQER
jgi:hypothetical protein